jgi:LPS-assembly lipoprotein
MWWSRAALLAALLLASSGCGFQARGNANFPPEFAATYIDTADRYSPFYQELVTALRRSQLEIVDSRADAQTVIRISQDETGRRVQSVSPRNVPREFEVFYRIRYSVERDGVEVLEPQSLTRNRDYTYDETLVLGKALEEETLRRALAADLVELVLRRVETID